MTHVAASITWRDYDLLRKSRKQVADGPLFLFARGHVCLVGKEEPTYSRLSLKVKGACFGSPMACFV